MQGDLKATIEAKKKENDCKFQSKSWGDALGLYVHVPFCPTACDFCAFYQEQTDRSGIESYLEGIKREAALYAIGKSVDSYFFGGGTPGLLTAKDLGRLSDVLIDHFGAPSKEWTVEMAPSTIKADKLNFLKDLGVTRISMGVQSFDDKLLDALGRQHSRKQVFRAYEEIRAVGFESINLDLIFAIPGQDADRLVKDIEEAASLEPDHISTYCLTFEEDTALYAKLARGEISLDVDREAELYLSCWQSMANSGYDQYEVSNFSKPGHECVHNVNTWEMQQWMGLGPSASSQFGGFRYSNVPDLSKWGRGLIKGMPNRIEIQKLTASLLMEDALIFGLRMNSGVDVEGLSERFEQPLPRRISDILSEMESNGYLDRSGARIALTESGRLLADAIGEMLMEDPRRDH
ncbi:MAG TPA: coproporphyrinogen III oxidase [Opitutae bacterium]|nr:coproporphyrinogen III oxidase [Opitutaceae bacterium]HCR29405.1 coproporphyrinogen III oxidase [Opitutae bacterium]